MRTKGSHLKDYGKKVTSDETIGGSHLHIYLYAEQLSEHHQKWTIVAAAQHTGKISGAKWSVF